MSWTKYLSIYNRLNQILFYILSVEPNICLFTSGWTIYLFTLGVEPNTCLFTSGWTKYLSIYYRLNQILVYILSVEPTTAYTTWLSIYYQLNWFYMGVAADRSICLSRFVSSNEFCTCYYHITLCYGKAEMQMYTAYQWNMQYTKVVTMHVQTCNPCVGKT
jgi:hypothetical protein